MNGKKGEKKVKGGKEEKEEPTNRMREFSEEVKKKKFSTTRNSGLDIKEVEFKV